MLRDHHINLQAEDGQLAPPKSPFCQVRAGSKPPPSDTLPNKPTTPTETAQKLMDLMSRGQAKEAFQNLVEASEESEPDSSHPIVLPFSLIDLMNQSIEHASCIINHTDAVRMALMILIHGEEITDSDTCRLWIRFLDAPVPPSSCIGSVSHSALMAHNISLNDKTSRPECLVSFQGAVLGLSTVWRQVYRKSYICSLCGTEFDLLEGQSISNSFFCCRTPSITEDMSKRILVPCQDLLIGDLASADRQLTASSIQAESILVSLVDDLTSTTPLMKNPRRGLEVGDCVSIIGFARSSVQPSGNQGWGPGKHIRFTTHVTAMSINLCCPYLLTTWVDAYNPRYLSNVPRMMTRGENMEGEERTREEEEEVDLDVLLSGFFASLVGCDSQEVPFEIPLSLLLSATNAAAATALALRPPAVFVNNPTILGGKRMKGPQANQSRATRPIQILVLGDVECPMLLDRVLKPAALALCPNTVHPSGPHIDYLFLPKAVPYQPLSKANTTTPSSSSQLIDPLDGYRGGSKAGGRSSAVTDESGKGTLMVRSSILTSANRGIFIADGRALGSTPKQKLEILEGMMRGYFVVNAPDSIAIGSGGAKAAGGGATSLRVPMTTTLWATAPSSQLTAKGGSRLGGPEPDGFDLIVKWDEAGDAFVMDHLGLREDGSCLDENRINDEANRAVTFLRRRIAMVAKNALAVAVRTNELDGEGGVEEGGRPRFTSDALALLQRFVMSVRQSFDSGGGGGGGGGGYRSATIASLVHLLVNLATASARIMLRSTVECYPDCTLAILLCHVTLKHRLGASGYYNACIPDTLDPSVGGGEGERGGGGDPMVRDDGGRHQASVGFWLLELHDHLMLTLREVAAPTGSLVDGFDWPSEI